MRHSGTAFSVFAPDDLNSAQRAKWAQICSKDRRFQSPFFSLDYLCRLSSVKSGGIKICAAEWDGGHAAFLPYEEPVEGVGVPPGWPTSEYQALISDAAPPFTAIDMLRGAKLNIFFQHQGLIEQDLFSAPHSAYRQQSFVYDTLASTAIPGEASKNFRKRLRRSRSAFIETFGEEPRVTLEPASPEQIDLILGWKQRHYEETRVFAGLFRHETGNLFEILPWLPQLFHSAANFSTEQFRLSAALLRAGPKLIVAGELLACSKYLAHSVFSGYLREHAAISPGLLLSSMLLESAETVGLPAYDLGYGSEDYKKYLSNRTVELASFVTAVPEMSANPALLEESLVHALETICGAQLTADYTAAIGRIVKSGIQV
jgi:CelD/BcsL family acetyltransferase involved in cellulose biosynthesis